LRGNLGKPRLHEVGEPPHYGNPLFKRGPPPRAFQRGMCRHDGLVDEALARLNHLRGKGTCGRIELLEEIAFKTFFAVDEAWNCGNGAHFSSRLSSAGRSVLDSASRPIPGRRPPVRP